MQNENTKDVFLHSLKDCTPIKDGNHSNAQVATACFILFEY